ncbi:recombinase family protein [Streptomyces sp. 8N616]|uniref:recombinase family protein n=1 Tax=Streptomyces sp. 8N616 TaxID=3457414 RepID=UPI003FD489C0
MAGRGRRRLRRPARRPFAAPAHRHTLTSITRSSQCRCAYDLAVARSTGCRNSTIARRSTPTRPRGVSAAAPPSTPPCRRPRRSPRGCATARCSTAQQELQSRLDALHEAGGDPIFSERISTRIKVRPEFVTAMDFARAIKKAVPHQRVIFTVHEMKRLGRGAAELQLSEQIIGCLLAMAVDAMCGMVTQVRPPRRDEMNAYYRAVPLCDPDKLQPNRHTGDANA